MGRTLDMGSRKGKFLVPFHEEKDPEDAGAQEGLGSDKS